MGFDVSGEYISINGADSASIWAVVRTHIRYLSLEIASTVRVGAESKGPFGPFVLYTLSMKIKENVDLSLYTTLGIPITAQKLISVEEVSDLDKISFKEDHILLGGGSNIVLTDAAKDIIKVDIKGIEENDKEVIVGAGEEWDSFVGVGIRMGVPLVENLSGIPGSVGASPVQNIGAYGVEVKDIINWVEAYDTKERKVKRMEDCSFGYRDSIFKHTDRYIITRVSFNKRESGVNISYRDLSLYFKNSNPSKKEVRKAVLEIRSKKFPNLDEYGTAGSFFKNPVVDIDEYQRLIESYPLMPSYNFNDKKKIPLAWVLDNVCNLKGYREGNVWLYEKQPLVLVTNKKATADEIKKFGDKIKQIVFSKTKIQIENEVTFL